MPELPEVETIRRELQQAVLGKKIEQVIVRNAKVIRHPAAAGFKSGVTGATITRVYRRGKTLAMELSTGAFLTVHLKMTGQLIYPSREAPKESRVVFRLSGGDNLDLRDRRLFAELRLLDEWRDVPFIRALGPEADNVPLSSFRKMLAPRKTAIKPLLMDQAFIAGIGNLYAAEILFSCGIHPARPASSLSAEEVRRLHAQIRRILKQAIEHKGSSVDQYVQLSGEQGGYVKYHKVYGRQGQPCRICKTPIQRVRLGGRGTYFCPRCQKKKA